MATIAVGMSGGVDSSAAALLLLRQGYRVEGVTLRLRRGLPGGDAETGEQDIADARRVCDTLGIPHHVLDLSALFREQVVEEFVAEYLAGRTPNPCVTCNRTVKFGAMLAFALENGFDGIATGHYAHRRWDEAAGRWQLLRGDSRKDQSYVLWGLSQHQLAHTLFPLAGLEKGAVRALAREAGLPVADKGDSMEICFVPDDGYAAFLERYTGRAFPPGDFLDGEGHVLGRHQGIARYTIGQRKGLGISFGKPMFVTGIDAAANTVTLGEEGRQCALSLTADAVNFVSIAPPDAPIRVAAKIRYQASPAAATLYPAGGDTIRLTIDTPQRSVTPGQSVVFYEDRLLLGGGRIIMNS